MLIGLLCAIGFLTACAWGIRRVEKLIDQTAGDED